MYRSRQCRWKHLLDRPADYGIAALPDLALELGIYQQTQAGRVAKEDHGRRVVDNTLQGLHRSAARFFRVVTLGDVLHLMNKVDWRTSGRSEDGRGQLDPYGSAIGVTKPNFDRPFTRDACAQFIAVRPRDRMVSPIQQGVKC
jgi:hypothetical protein